MTIVVDWDIKASVQTKKQIMYFSLLVMFMCVVCLGPEYHKSCTIIKHQVSESWCKDRHFDCTILLLPRSEIL